MIVGVMASTVVSSEQSSDYDITIQVGIVSLFNATSHFRASQSRSLTSSRSSSELRRQNASRKLAIHMNCHSAHKIIPSLLFIQMRQLR
ncbi:hypothetical protein LXL04_035181 [Taraxacum kok-saghyz]